MCVYRCVCVQVCTCIRMCRCVHIQTMCVCVYRCVCVQVCTRTHVYPWKRAGMKPPCTEQKKEHPHHDVWATAWTAAMLSRAWGLKDWASQPGSAIQPPRLEHSISALPFSEGSPPRTGVRCEQQKSPESDSESYANTNGHYYPFIPMPRRVTFEPMSLTSGVYSHHRLLSAKEEGMWTMFQRGNAF